MGYFNKDNNRRSGGGRSFGNRSFGGKRSFGGNRPVRHPEMHDAVCSSCGKACQLPFKPTGDRPVYCRDCFAKNGAGDGSFQRNDGPKPAFKKIEGPREAAPRNSEFDALNAKLDKILALLSAQAPEALSTSSGPAIEEAAPVEKKKRVSKKAEVAAE